MSSRLESTSSVSRIAPLRSAHFITHVLSNTCNRAILAHWPTLHLPDGWLVAGCLFQTIWNLQSGRPADEGIKDYDVFYFDDSDLSERAEAAVQASVDRVLGHLGVSIEVKNQARVHLWYEEHFGHSYPRLINSRDGIDRFLVLATCVGVRPADVEQGFEIYAPNGLHELYGGVLAPNPLTNHRELFHAKAASYQERWPWLCASSPPCTASHVPSIDLSPNTHGH